MSTPYCLPPAISEVLERRFPNVLARMLKEGSRPGVHVQVARSGAPTIVVTASDGSPRLLHSAYDPVAESRTLLGDLQVPDGGSVICIGSGLWYHIERLIETHPEIARCVVIEPDPRVLAHALCARDVSRVLGDPRVFLACADDEPGIFRCLQAIGGALLHNGVRLFVLTAAERAAPETYRRVREAVIVTVRAMEIAIRTNLVNVGQFHANVLRNLPAIVSSPGISSLRGCFAGTPALCVNAGPSLDRNIDAIHGAVGRALIIAVDVVLHRLLERGIVPDIVVAMDFLPRHYHDTFAGAEDRTAETFLVFDPELCPEVVRTWRGGAFVYGLAKPMPRWISSILGDPGTIEKGGCVGHAAFFLAEYLQCDPIVLVGQDLSYPGITHAAGVRVRQEVTIGDGSDGRKYLLRKNEDGTWSASELFMVRDIHGGEVPTDHQMFTYLRQLESAISRTAHTVIDATEGGAFITGTKIMPLVEVVNRYCTAPVNARSILADRAAAHRSRTATAAMTVALDELIALLEQARAIAAEGAILIQKIQKHIAHATVPDTATEHAIRAAEEKKDQLQGLPLWFREIAEYQMHANVWLINAAAVRSLSLTHANIKQKIEEISSRFDLYFQGYIAVADDLLPRCRSARAELRGFADDSRTRVAVDIEL